MMNEPIILDESQAFVIRRYAEIQNVTVNEAIRKALAGLLSTIPIPAETQKLIDQYNAERAERAASDELDLTDKTGWRQ